MTRKALLLTILLLCSLGVSANDEIQGGATITLENDLFVGGDGGYTNGLVYSWGYTGSDDYSELGAPDWMTSIADNLYIGTKKGQKAVSYSIFQTMQTPEDLTRTDLIVNDFPYSGTLGWAGTLHTWDDDTSDELKFLIGVVGPWSLAEQSQRFIHELTGSEEPLGWDHQLHNELAFTIDSRHKWRLVHGGSDLEFDIISTLEVEAGTFRSGIGGNLIFRFGNDLKSTHHTAALLPGRDINPLSGLNRGFYVYAGLQIDYIFNDLFVDGNTFRNSHSLPLKHERYNFAAGFAWHNEGWGILLSLAESSSPTTISNAKGKFGSLSVSYRF